jgi:outer membrane protein, heavy metal efflux system
MAGVSITEGGFKLALALFRRGWVVILLIQAFGCTTYRPLNLTTDSVDSRLQPPALADLQILASKISHPILRPVKLQPGQELTPDSAAILAVLLNPGLRAARDGRGLADAQLMAAGLLPDPELSLSADVPSGGDTSGKVNAYGLGLSWEATSLLSRGARISRARAERRQVDLEIAWQEWQVAQAAKAAVYRLVVLERQIVLAQQHSTLTTQNLARVQKGVTAGFMTAGTLNVAQMARLQASENLLDLKKRALQQRQQLKRLLGLPADSPLRLDKKISLPTRIETPDAPALLQGLEQRRLDLLALRCGYASQEAAVRAAVLDQFPKITLGPTLNRDTDNLRTIGFGVNIGLPLFNRNQGHIAQTRATRQLLFDEYARRVFEARSDIATILAGMSFANEQIAGARAAASETRKLLKNYRAALAAGRIDALVYASAWQDFVAAQMRVLNLEGELAQAEVALQLASGLYDLPRPGLAPASGSAAGPAKEPEGTSP